MNMRLINNFSMIDRNLNIKIIFIIILYLILFLNTVYALENKILFKVDNEIVTSVDILKEVKYLKIINPKLINMENKQMFEISKKSLIREKIKEIELLKYFDQLTIDDKYLNKLIINYFSDKINISTVKEFEKFFVDEKIDPEIIEKNNDRDTLESINYNKFNPKVKLIKM